jgi:Papain fold toxin 2
MTDTPRALPERQIQQIIQSFQNLECESCARAIRQWLRDSGYGLSLDRWLADFECQSGDFLLDTFD